MQGTYGPYGPSGPNGRRAKLGARGGLIICNLFFRAVLSYEQFVIWFLHLILIQGRAI
jgi:hypothetical protein